MSSLSKAFLMVGLFSVPLFAANASNGETVGPTRASTTVIKLMGASIGTDYYTMTTPLDTLNIGLADRNNSAQLDTFTLTKVNGIYQFPRSADVTFVPYKVINHQGYYPDPTQIEKVAHKIAVDNHAYAFQINSVEENTQGSHTQLQISLYEQNTPLFYHSALNHVYKGRTIRELTMQSEDRLQPMGKLQFNGNYTLGYEVTAEAAKQSIAKNASAFYVTSITENTQGTNQTVYVSYYQ